MNKKHSIKYGSAILMTVFLAACGSSGGSGTGNFQTGDALTLGITSLNTKNVVAAAPKGKIETMLAFLGGNEAVAAIPPGACGAGNDGKGFDLSGGGFVCLTESLLVYEEVELENEGSAVKDEVEAGPFLIDMIGTPDDGILGTVTLNVPDGNFSKLELKVGDLDDRNSNDSLDDNGTDIIPTNVAVADVNTAGMAGKSLKITGIADDGVGNKQPFTFFTNIEGKMEMPITIPAGGPLVVDGSTLITFVDLSSGFLKLTFADITATMDGTFPNPTESCTNGNKFQTLACDIVKNVELFHDINDDRKLDDTERRGDDRGGVAGSQPFDDNPNARD